MKFLYSLEILRFWKRLLQFRICFLWLVSMNVLFDLVAAKFMESKSISIICKISITSFIIVKIVLIQYSSLVDIRALCVSQRLL